MRWATYRSEDGTDRVGLVDGDHLRAVTGVGALLDLLGDDGERLASAAEQATNDPLEVVELAGADLLAPIPVPPSVRDFMAFEEHVANTRSRTGSAVDPGWYERPVFYFTNPAAIRPPVADIAISPGSSWFDYELEVAAVIGRGGGDLHPDNAEQHIAGYLVLADWSARDLQRQEMASRLGPVKAKDSATSIGPFLVTPDELAHRRAGKGFDLAMSATVNGRTCSTGNWSAIHWSFGQMLAYASRGTRLVPGDIFGSGTVGTGCLLELSILHGEEKYPWLQAGDEVVLDIELLGSLTGRITPGSTPIPLG
jgi:2-keto-4-pentenoate hydratase/2-oxohepta-3-ene-1,7-dioic acid hydratase in catechol pathway